jgi:hypothetical protein
MNFEAHHDLIENLAKAMATCRGSLWESFTLQEQDNFRTMARQQVAIKEPYYPSPEKSSRWHSFFVYFTIFMLGILGGISLGPFLR